MKKLKTRDEIIRAIEDYAKSILPPGCCLNVSSGEMEITCDGKDSMFCYECGISPGHDGRCSSFNKDVDFTPQTGGPKTFAKGSLK